MVLIMEDDVLDFLPAVTAKHHPALLDRETTSLAEAVSSGSLFFKSGRALNVSRQENSRKFYVLPLLTRNKQPTLWDKSLHVKIAPARLVVSVP